ncbi:MAG: hypothetical protein AMXMBFR34_12550 [Myxococcaceae bacterium]
MRALGALDALLALVSLWTDRPCGARWAYVTLLSLRPLRPLRPRRRRGASGEEDGDGGGAEE